MSWKSAPPGITRAFQSRPAQVPPMLGMTRRNPAATATISIGAPTSTLRSANGTSPGAASGSARADEGEDEDMADSCGALLVAAGVVSLLWAKSAMQQNALRLAAAPIVAGLLLRHFDVAAPWQANRYSLAGDSAILAFVATFCFQAASRLWGRFNFVVLTWVEMMGNYPTSRIGTGNNFSSRVN